MADGHAHFKLTPQQIAEIKTSRERVGILAKRYNVAESTIQRHRNGEFSCSSERELRERARIKRRARDIRRENELQRRRTLMDEINSIGPLSWQ